MPVKAAPLVTGRMESVASRFEGKGKVGLGMGLTMLCVVGSLTPTWAAEEPDTTLAEDMGDTPGAGVYESGRVGAAGALEARGSDAVEADAPSQESQPPPPEVPAPAVQPPPVAPPPSPATGFTVRVYGVIRPELIMSTGVETFGKSTLAAPTAAAHPIANPLYEEWVNSFQLQQSRFGLRIGEGTPLEGRAEVDFIDPAFAQSSPIQGTRLRLRLAYITYAPAVDHKLTVGQNWDIFSPLNPATMNMVGVAYQAGNSGFIRPQVIYTYGSGDGIEVSGAIGMQRQNTGPAFDTLEYGLVPTFAVQVGYRQAKNWFGVSAIGSSQMTQLPTASEYAGTYAANAFASFGVSEALALGIEAYVGKNGNALGLLTLGSGTEVWDAGGYVSANFKLAPMHALWLVAGGAFVLNTDDLALGYTPATVEAPAARLGIGGIESNINLRAAYVLSPLTGLEFYLEPFAFITRHKLAAIDDPDDSLASRTAFGASLGSRFSF